LRERRKFANIDLPPQQVELVNAVTALGKPTVAVVAMGRRMIRSAPQRIISQGTDWRFLQELKRELK
jgi:hypothetical protein